MVSIFPCQAPDIVYLLILFACHLLTHLSLFLLQDRVQVVKLFTNQSLLSPTVLLYVREQVKKTHTHPQGNIINSAGPFFINEFWVGNVGNSVSKYIRISK